MFLILGLIILLVAVIVAFVGVMGNLGSAHELTNDFSVFGYHVTSSTGALFLYGIAVGVVGLIGLYLLLAAVRRASRRSAGVSRRESKVVDRERDDLIQQRDAARAQAEETRADDRPADVPASGHRRAKWFGRTTHR
ncbi:hypothetical protein ABT246_38665 [Streptomyces sp. NPDC001553]|uniref:hypothetical protein n=1 Tax=Streptomyces sp. NPDC001553 TaxID=3154385 RepID=UPI00332ACFAF